MFIIQYKVNRISNGNLKWCWSYNIKPNSKSFDNITCWLCPSEKGHDKWAAHCSNVLIQSFFFLTFQTFCVVSRRFQKHYVQRFSATRSLFIFPPWNMFRRCFIFLSVNQYFDYLVMLTILANCVFLAAPEINTEQTE